MTTIINNTAEIMLALLLNIGFSSFTAEIILVLFLNIITSSFF